MFEISFDGRLSAVHAREGWGDIDTGVYEGTPWRAMVYHHRAAAMAPDLVRELPAFFSISGWGAASVSDVDAPKPQEYGSSNGRVLMRQDGLERAVDVVA